MRIKRICSTQNEFEKHSNNILQQLKKKGYNHDMLKEQIEKARVEERALLLNKNPEKVKQSIPISITYNLISISPYQDMTLIKMLNLPLLRSLQIKTN